MGSASDGRFGSPRVTATVPRESDQRAVAPPDRGHVDRGDEVRDPRRAGVGAEVDGDERRRPAPDGVQDPGVGRGRAVARPAGARAAESAVVVERDPVAERVGQARQVPAVTAPAEVEEVVLRRIVVAGDVPVEEVAVAVAVPHLEARGAERMQQQLAAVARAEVVRARRLVEHALGPVRPDVAVRVLDDAAGLDRAGREAPADGERRVRLDRLVEPDVALVVGPGIAELPDDGVVREHRLKLEFRPDGIRRADGDRQRERPVVHVDRIDGGVVERALGIPGRRVRVGVGSVLSAADRIGCHEGAEGEQGREFASHVRTPFAELAGESLVMNCRERHARRGGIAEKSYRPRPSSRDQNVGFRQDSMFFTRYSAL